LTPSREYHIFYLKGRFMRLLKLSSLALLVVPGVWAQSIAGLWDGTLIQNGAEIPFKIGFSGTGSEVKGWFFNGTDKEVSNKGNFENGSLTLNFDSYASVLRLNLKDGVLDGQYIQRGQPMPIHAVRAGNKPVATSPGDANAPNVAGIWILEGVNSRKGEKAWNLILQQKGPEVSGAILRVDGDTGTLTGRFHDGKFVLSHFSGARPSLLVITPQKNGTLSLELNGLHDGGSITAVRPEEARAKNLPEPTDANAHTAVKDPSQPFPFRFPDLNGNIVSNTDARFRNKVVLINITGSWCPNCHDEAPFLAEIYNKYKSQGLEVVALSFEEEEQLQNPTRLRAFIQEYGIKYTVLLGGETSTAKEKLTQAVNWDAWPTTFFVGRDGLVKAVHAGFPGPGSGELYRRDKNEFIATVERLLAENQSSRK
jgi:thiol-disulfide isomerase/thioredoxin